ncbi:hypothetical protein EYF80_021936 [Liparis tanakae]|uniref:Uncharacterized protein n=1 Tax=Liparis tanakae TaxID=230148 RepID=A0A4Z2HSI0_9TELE|nr:hypothetical protein EYF80_021936 [Liparis tanakae]
MESSTLSSPVNVWAADRASARVGANGLAPPPLLRLRLLASLPPSLRCATVAPSAPLVTRAARPRES